MSPALTVERIGPGGAVARLTLSRPDVHNAFDAALIGELRAAFAALAREGPTELRAVVLRGDELCSLRVARHQGLQGPF